MRAGFHVCRAPPQDGEEHPRDLAQGKLEMPILVYGGGDAKSGRANAALESWQRVGSDVSGGVADGCGHWIAEERPEWVAERFLEFFASARS